MAIIKPFGALRPRPELAKDVAALPYDVMSSEEARIMVAENPYSFLHVDKAEIDLDPLTSIYDPTVYTKAKENLEAMEHKGVLIRDGIPSYYIYRLVMDGREQTGFVACTSIDDYVNDIIKKHEHTRADKEQDRINHVKVCNAQTGPIFLAYRESHEITDCIEQWKNNHSPIYDFVAEDDVAHTVWIIDDFKIQAKLTESFSRVPNLYIADGHHRAASAVKVGLEKRKNNSESKNAEFNSFLSVLFPANQLYIMDYNRVVKDLNNLSESAFIKAMENSGIKIKKDTESNAFSPKKANTYGMYLPGSWYYLDSSKIAESIGSSVERLDVSILQDYILDPILGINDPRTNQRIHFVGGIRGLGELEQMVDSGEYAVAFSMYPTSMDEVMDIADCGRVMPPKSTWFEPKLRSGLFIHSLE